MQRHLLAFFVLAYFSVRGFFEKVVWGHWYGFPLDDVWLILGGWTALAFAVASRFRARRWVWVIPALFAALAAASCLHEKRAYAALERATIRLREDKIGLQWGFVYYSRSFRMCVQSFVGGDPGVPIPDIEARIAESFRDSGFSLDEIHLTDARD